MIRRAGPVAIITGGGTGIGLGISRALAQSGAAVVVAQPDLAVAEAAAAELRADGFEALAVTVEVRSREHVRAAIAQAIVHWGRLDVLVNSAALSGGEVISPFLDCSDETLGDIIDVNLKGPFIASQEAARVMKEHGGTIIHIASVGAFAAQEGAAVYCATKAALVSAARSMALELAPYGIRVNCVAPGDILTTRSGEAQAAMRLQGLSGEYGRRIPLGRQGRPSDIGAAVAFLASPDAAYITGQTLVVDGGYLSY